jgi:hypothetical protein
VIALVGLGDQLVNPAAGDLGEDAIAFANGQEYGIQHGVDATDDVRIGAIERLGFAAVGELPLFGSVGEAVEFFLQTLQHDGYVVDGLFHFFVIALVGLGDQLVDLAAGYLGEDAVTFADRQKDGIDSTDDVRIGAVEGLGFATVGELSILGSVGEAVEFFLQTLQYKSHVVDGLFHFFVIALVGLGYQLVDLAARDLGENAVTFADRQKDGIQHGIDSTDDVRIGAVEGLWFAAFGELPILGSVGEAEEFFLQTLQHKSYMVDGQLHFFVIALIGLGDQFIDLAARDLRQDTISFTNGYENRFKHLVYSGHDFAMHAVELVQFASFVKTPLTGRFHEA